MSKKTQNLEGIQPGILRWAREQSGKTIEDVGRALKKDATTIEAWEKGQSTPTYVQLEELAYSVYKRPLAIFFLPEPPSEPDLKHSFRTLSSAEIEALKPDTLFAIRQAWVYQMNLQELNEGNNQSSRLIFRDLKIDLNVDVNKLAERLRNYLEINVEMQNAWKNVEEALEIWREKVEHVGVFVFKRTFKQADISAFCLYDEQFPIIVINNSTHKTRQIFSLIHELGHILLHMNCLAKSDDKYISFLPDADRAKEEMCNKLAAEVLVPSSDFSVQSSNLNLDNDALSKLADRYKVSREVILRKLLDRNLINREIYNKKVEEWRKQGEKSRKSGGGNYYRTQAAYLGKTYLSLVFSQYYQRKFGIEQVADYLGVKASSVAGIEQVFSSKQALE